MKKLIIVLCMVISMVIIMSFSGGIGDRTNSPGETNCTSCHTSFPLNSGTGSISITDNIPGTGYVPGQTYTINVTVAQSGAPLFGFDFEALTPSNTTAGNIIITNPSSTKLIMPSTRQNVTHVTNGGLTPNSKTFTFNWTAPATNIGNVTFYASGNAANNNGNNSGDYIYTTSKVIPPAMGGLTLNLTALIEGLYSGTGMTMVPDQITVELHSSTSPSVVVASKTGTLGATGTCQLIFTAGTTGVPYYIVVKHRNALETWSKPVTFATTTLAYDFTTAASKAYGNQMKLKGTKWCLYSGDINEDGVIEGIDYTGIYNDASIFKDGYLDSDLTGDNIVEGIDATIGYNNSAFIESKHP